MFLTRDYVLWGTWEDCDSQYGMMNDCDERCLHRLCECATQRPRQVEAIVG